MPDTKISALTEATVLTDLDELAVNDGGVSKRVTLNTLVAYIEQRGRQNDASVANQAGFAADTYLVGSDINIPAGRLQVRSMYRCRFNVVKTAAGVATPIISVRFGTLGTTADVARGTLTFPAQTAVVDEGFIEVLVTFRAVGAAGNVQAFATLQHRAFTSPNFTGLSIERISHRLSTPANFDTTVAGSIIGLSVNGGTAAAWTVSLVQTELFNLA